MPSLVRLIELGMAGPAAGLARLWSATAVREQGSVSGNGWSGRRYAFELVATASTTTLRTVMEFSDYGAPEVVSAPPAREAAAAELRDAPMSVPPKAKR